jgi:hypothetical protein
MASPPAHSCDLAGLIGEAYSHIASCKRDLARLDMYLAQMAAFAWAGFCPAPLSACQPAQDDVCRRCVEETRALAGETNDPRIKLLLNEFADRYQEVQRIEELSIATCLALKLVRP